MVTAYHPENPPSMSLAAGWCRDHCVGRLRLEGRRELRYQLFDAPRCFQEKGSLCAPSRKQTGYALASHDRSASAA
jgi:hypothetical protein